MEDNKEKPRDRKTWEVFKTNGPKIQVKDRKTENSFAIIMHT